MVNLARRKWLRQFGGGAAGLLAGGVTLAQSPAVTLAQRGDGYRGIWYFNQPSGDAYVYKYSGGFATYPQQQSPAAIYVPQQRKTFFVYGGMDSDPGQGQRPELLHMVSYFDHRTGRVPRPVVLLNKRTEDAHDNPILSIDGSGHLWVFSNAHGTTRPAYIHRSNRPYSIDGFTLVYTGNFSYGHIWNHPQRGFTFLHSRYEDKGRSLYQMRSRDGQQWSQPELLARAELGHYQITAHAVLPDGGERLASVFDVHPQPVGLNARTNLYYMESRDQGQTWQNVRGEALSMPLRQMKNGALVRDFASEGLLVYVKEVAFGQDGHPVILYLTTKGFASGPAAGPRRWYTARWTGQEWQHRLLTESDHNYDHGGLWVETDGTWQVIAPTEPGPQPFTTGGDMVLWRSKDQGASWTKVKQLTKAAHWNHTYARKPVNAHPAFYAYWADGDTLRPSQSRLYFTDREGKAVWQLPTQMRGDWAKPLRVK